RDRLVTLPAPSRVHATAVLGSTRPEDQSNYVWWIRRYLVGPLSNYVWSYRERTTHNSSYVWLELGGRDRRKHTSARLLTEPAGGAAALGTIDRMGNRTSPHRIAAAKRQARAIELRQQGMTYDQIAVEVGYSCRGSAQRAVVKALDHVTREPAKELLGIELERLDNLQRGVWDRAIDGDLKALDAVLRIMTHRAKLLRLDRLEPAAKDAAIPAPPERAAHLQRLLREYHDRYGHDYLAETN